MGWWIRPDGKWKSIPDHFEYLRAHPTEFGFKKKDAAGWGLANRTAVIEEATRRGFIRVRGASPHLSVEFWELNNDTIANLKDFLSSEGIAPGEKVMFEEGSTERSWYREAAWILDDVALAAAANPKGKGRRRS